MKVTYLFIVAIGLALILGCSETPSGPSTSSVLMPLAVGNEWITKTAFTDSVGYEFDSKLDTFKIVRTLAKDDLKYYLDERGRASVNISDGLWFNHGFSYNSALIPYPVSIGVLLIRDTLQLASPDTIVTVIQKLVVESSDTVVTTPAGTFTCYKYHFQYYLLSNNELYFEENHYYAPNVGFIKLEQQSKNGAGKWYTNLTEILLSYHLEP